MKADDVAQMTRGEWSALIDECIFNANYRRIFKRRWLDGVKLEPLAEEFNLSARHVQRIVKLCEHKIINYI